MDSFFATVEQQANPALRGKPIVVSGKEGSRSVIVASSREAKFYGVKTAMLHHEARKLCPNLIFVEGDGAKYSFLHQQFVKIFKSFTSQVEVFSIDEAFLDLTGLVDDWSSAKEVALMIKSQIKTKLGEWVSCSIGIAENKLLAKLASDLDKPNGLVVINEDNLDKILFSTKLTDFCGIGRGLVGRLNNLGVDSVRKLREYPLEALIDEFGPHSGRFLHDLSYGRSDDPVVSDLEESQVKSVSRSYTLPYDTFDKEEILTVMLHLCEKVGRDLRRKKLAGKTVVVYLRYSDFTHVGLRRTLAGHVDSGLELFKLGATQLSGYRLAKGVRLVGVHVSKLVENYKQQSLWGQDRQLMKILPCLDEINNTYGELTIKPAYLLKLKRLKGRVGGFKIQP